MKTKMRILFFGALTLITSESAQAGLYTENFSSGGSVGAISGIFPMGTYFTGNVNNANAGDTVSWLTVTLTVSFTAGDYGNGSSYAYLVSPNNTPVQLFGSQSGGEAYGIGGSAGNPFGNSGSGLNVTLADSASISIQNAPDGTITGTYRAMDSLADINGSSVNGDWTLFFTETASGGPASMLDDWSLNIQAVPEPANLALEIMVMAGTMAMARERVRRLLRRRS
jgi:hypothetical protein